MCSGATALETLSSAGPARPSDDTVTSSDTLDHADRTEAFAGIAEEFEAVWSEIFEDARVSVSIDKEVETAGEVTEGNSLSPCVSEPTFNNLVLSLIHISEPTRPY